MTTTKMDIQQLTPATLQHLHTTAPPPLSDETLQPIQTPRPHPIETPLQQQLYIEQFTQPPPTQPITPPPETLQQPQPTPPPTPPPQQQEEIDKYIGELLNRYIDTLAIYEKINKSLDKTKKIRNENFPSHISENIVKIILNKTKYKNSPNKVLWNTNIGDLSFCGSKIEVKGFMSAGPSSFGPTERWETLYFIDAKNIQTKHVKIYEIALSNTDAIWRNLKINKTETYGNQCIQGRRPRIEFHKMLAQLPQEKVNLVFDGDITPFL